MFPSTISTFRIILILTYSYIVYELKNELSQLKCTHADLKDEHARAKIELESQIDNLSIQLKNQVEIYESMRKDYEYRIQSVKERYDFDRAELKKEYDNVIANT